MIENCVVFCGTYTCRSSNFHSNSPHGRHRFLPLRFGLICAQDLFQKKVDEAFGDVLGVTEVADEILVYQAEPALNKIII